MRGLRWKRWAARVGGGLGAVVVGLLVTVKARHGGATVPFANMSTAPRLGERRMEIVATLDEPPGNIAVAASGRIFFCFHPEGRPSLKVVELVNGAPVPFPDATYQTAHGDAPFFDTVFAVRIDRQNRLWTLDHGFHGLRQPRLLAFDIDSRKLVHDGPLPSEVAGVGSFVQDFQIDPAGKIAYIADTGVLSKNPAIIVYDIEKKSARRRLARDFSVSDKPYTIDAKGQQMSLLGGLFNMHPAIDPIGLDRTGEYLFFGPMSSETMFRVRTRELLDDDLDPAILSQHVEPYGTRCQSDGISTDDDGNVYLTDIEHGAIARLGVNRTMETLIVDPRVRWPDGLSFGPDGWLYVTDSDLADVMMRSKDHISKSAPFFIWRFQPGATAAPGH